jgi:hypothetical protein
VRLSVSSFFRLLPTPGVRIYSGDVRPGIPSWRL